MTTVLPAPTAGQVAVDPAAPCAAPDCGVPLDEHSRPQVPGVPAGPFHVDGLPAGSAECAHRLHQHRHPVITVPLKSCGCLVGDVCRCAAQTARDRAELATVPTFHLGGTR